MNSPPSPFLLRVPLAPALRHWISNSFAVGSTAGLRFNYSFVSTELAGVSLTQTSLATSLFASLQLMGVF